MSIRLVFWKLELKRACKRLPQMFAGAIVLLFLAGAVALLAGRALYGDKAAGRVVVGVVLPEEDGLSKQMISMIHSLDSVKSMCDFRYMNQAESLEGLKNGELSAVMDVPKGLIQGIMNGTNPSVRILLPEGAWLESRIFKELTQAGAQILGASQAGIYGGNELYQELGWEEKLPGMEQDLNQIFLSYSLPREDYFRHQKVSATEDVNTAVFFGISGYVLFLLLSAIPVSGYLLPFSETIRRKLNLAGVGGFSRITGRIAGLGSLFFMGSVAMGAVVWTLVRSFDLDVRLWTGGWQRDNFGILAMGTGAAVLVLVCLAGAAWVVLIYQAAGNLLGGIFLLFLTVTAQHFLAGGFLPEVFLPEILRKLTPVMPSGILMNGVKMAVTGAFSVGAAGKLAALLFVGFFLAAFLEMRKK